MPTLRTIAIATIFAPALGACTQMPGRSAEAAPLHTTRMAAMDAHMKSMHEGMAMMGGMQGRMGGMGPMAGAAPADMASRMQAMEKHMEMMMHAMMQSMMDRMGPPPAAR